MRLESHRIETGELSINESNAGVWRLLEKVCDPDIPTVSVVEMGIVDSVIVKGTTAEVVIIPTFSGCPAIHVIISDIQKVLEREGFRCNVQVAHKPWSSDKMTESARVKLKAIGIAPPEPSIADSDSMTAHVACPYCDSSDTILESAFGATLCRALYYCPSCQQPFEKFKSL